MEQVKINIDRDSYKSAIIILNWNGLADTLECLLSVQKHCINENFLVLLIDNHSKESIDPFLAQTWEIPILLIKNDENSGFAQGNNIGAAAALEYKPDYLLLLNNDTVLLNNMLGEMTGIFEKYPKVGVAGAVNYYFSNPATIWQAGAKVSLQTGKIKLVNIDPAVEIMNMDFVPGSSIMMRSEIVNRIGLFDPNFFAYSEELDFCLRAKKIGYDVVCVTKAKLLHKVGKASPRPAKEYLRLRNKFYLFRRHSKPLNFIFISANETTKALIKATIELFKKGTTVYYSAVYFAIRDYNKKSFGIGACGKFF